MSWQVTAYAMLALVLAGGFAWYERSRPPARMVALVAALAALAVAGRLVFTPIPNVVATTDIALIAGYSVGAAPGFAVGALAAVVSNLWLGQGPWTPWEMAGWGLVGVGGAALGAVARRRLGRATLAIACGVAGLAYGALLDLSVMVGYGGEQSLDRYLAISARGVPFNVAHAAGNVALALAAGPALVRMISRYRTRFEFEWLDGAPRRRRAFGAIPFSALLVVALLVLPLGGAQGRGSASGSRWLQRVQSPDGGFPASPGGTSSAAMTGWASLGLEAAGRNPLDLDPGGRSPIDFLRASVDTLRSTGDLERTILALEGAGIDAHRFGGRALVAKLRGRRSRSGSFEGQVNLTAFGILALRSAGCPVSGLGRSAKWLRGAQNRDGGWGFRRQAASDADSTGAALQALAAARARSGVRPGVTYLRRTQRRDGGYALAGSGASNTQSTAWAVQGLVAAGVNPAGVRKASRSPLAYLARRQAGDGHYRYSSASDQTPIWVTGQALVAINRKAFPLAAVPRSPRAAGSRTSAAGANASADGSVARSGAGAARAGQAAGGTESGKPGGRPHAPGGARGGLTGDPVSAPAQADAPSSDHGGLGLAAYVALGFVLLIAALVAGFLWYRRRIS